MLALLCAGASLGCDATAATPPNFVYVLTNQSSGNTVLVYSRGANGALTQIQEISTQGLGSGGNSDPLGSQGSLTLSANGMLLLAVNAGSNQLTSFQVTPTGLVFGSVVPSGGTFPVSAAIQGSRAYVLNQSGNADIKSFQIGSGGVLTPIRGTRTLPGRTLANPGDIAVSPDGSLLVVTEKHTNQIDLFLRGAGGGVSSVPSNGLGPFGFSFGANQTLIVAEATLSTVSSYRIVPGTNPSLQTITPSLPDSGGTACWVVTSPAGDIAYVVNSLSRTISTLAVSPAGALTLISAAAATLGSGKAPIDLAITHDGQFLYVVTTTNGIVAEYSVNGGVLTPIGNVTGLPISIQGIAAW